MNAFDSILASAFATVKTVKGTAVTYRRGTSSVRVTAVSAAPATMVDQSGAPVYSEHESADWLILAAELTFAGVAVTPQRGDRIQLADGRVYAVLPTGSEPVFHWTPGAARTQMRVHTKLVEQ